MSTMASGALFLLGIGLFVAVVMGTIYIATSRYKLAPSDKILVVYGNVKTGGAAACYHGGGPVSYTHLTLPTNREV